MVHYMKLENEHFEKLRAGKKTVELRLFDSKRRGIDIGDRIIFENTDNPVLKVAVTVKSLHRYATFEDLFKNTPLEKCGFDNSKTIEMATEQMSKYYTEDMIRINGVLGIEVELADIEKVIAEQEEEYANYYERLFPDGMK